MTEASKRLRAANLAARIYEKHGQVTPLDPNAAWMVPFMCGIVLGATAENLGEANLDQSLETATDYVLSLEGLL